MSAFELVSVIVEPPERLSYPVPSLPTWTVGLPVPFPGRKIEFGELAPEEIACNVHLAEEVFVVADD